MAFHHMPTFLRSAMARDPFCHSGIITPEDVLRLEAKFPTLFDKPAPPSSSPTPIDFVESKRDSESDGEEDVGKTGNHNSGNKLERKSKVTNLVSGRKLKAVPLPANNARSTNAKPGIQTKKKANIVVARTVPRPRPTNTQTQGQKKIFSEFHRKCIEQSEETTGSVLGQPKKEEHSTPKGKGVGGGGGGSKLVRPAQSFSLEDLRATLREVMREEALQFNQGWKADKGQPSPYTEDLVKKFLGWKMQIARGADAGGRRQRMNANQIDQWKGQGDVIGQGSRMNTEMIPNDAADYHIKTTLVRDGEGERKKLSLHTAVASSPMQKERVPRIRSAPGFLRGISELPPVPKYQKKRMMLSMARESGGSFRKQGQDERKSFNENQEIGGGGDGDESRRKHVTWEESVNEEENEDANGSDKRAQKCEELIRKHTVKHGSKRPGMRGTPIHLRSHKKDVPEYGDGDAFTNDERFKVKSSYHQLLAARTEKNRYELKGRLRKEDIPCNFYTSQVKREREERGNVRERDGGTYFLEKESSSDPSENFKRKVKEMGQRSKEETNKVLEKIAQELVYMEVLHQIDELKREQTQEATKKSVDKETDVSSSPMPSPRNLDKLLEAILPDFKATTTDADGESESGSQNKGKKVSEEISLKTPELTPPTTGIKNNRLIGAARIVETSSLKGNESSAEVISLHTPKLSPSPNKRLIAAIKERKELQEKKHSPQTQQHMDTDCSEMSDFVFSEASKREENQKDNKRKQKSEESVKLKTPELSNSQQHQVRLNENTPEKDKSTLSGVPSEFLKTLSKSKESVEDQEQEDNRLDESQKENTHSAKYSDDFIPEGEVSSVSDRSSTAVVPEKNTGPKHLPAVRDGSGNVEESEEADHEDDNVENLNMSGETVIDLLSEGEFIGEAYRSPGEVSLRGGSRGGGTGNRSSVGSSSQANKHTSGGTSVHENEQRLMRFMSSIASSSNEIEDENSSISVLSFGAQVGGGNGERPNIVSFGEYIKRLEF